MDQPQIVPQSEAQTPAPQSDYHSFLLRLWLVPGGQDVKWRASLENVQTGELHGFEEIEGLQDYLDVIAGSEGKMGESRRDPTSTA